MTAAIDTGFSPEVAAGLSRLPADTYAAYLKTRCHWLGGK